MLKIVTPLELTQGWRGFTGLKIKNLSQDKTVWKIKVKVEDELIFSFFKISAVRDDGGAGTYADCLNKWLQMADGPASVGDTNDQYEKQVTTLKFLKVKPGEERWMAIYVGVKEDAPAGTHYPVIRFRWNIYPE